MTQAHRELWSRLGATKMMLNRMSTPARANMSSIQANAFRASVASLPTAMSETDAAALSELAFDVGFAEDDLSSVVDSLQAATKSKSGRFAEAENPNAGLLCRARLLHGSGVEVHAG